MKAFITHAFGGDDEPLANALKEDLGAAFTPAVELGFPAAPLPPARPPRRPARCALKGCAYGTCGRPRT